MSMPAEPSWSPRNWCCRSGSIVIFVSDYFWIRDIILNKCLEPQMGLGNLIEIKCKRTRIMQQMTKRSPWCLLLIKVVQNFCKLYWLILQVVWLENRKELASPGLWWYFILIQWILFFTCSSHGAEYVNSERRFYQACGERWVTV